MVFCHQSLNNIVKRSDLFSTQILHHDRRAVIVHHVNSQAVWATCNREIIVRHAGDQNWQTHAWFPRTFPRDLFLWSRPTTRAMRADKCNLFPTQSKHLLGIRGSVVYRIESDHPIPLFSIQGDCVLHASIVEAHSGNVYFGEYFRNPERQSVNLWCVSQDLTQFDIAHTFQPGEIRHIHGVYKDPFCTHRLWATVGDYKDECYLIVSDDEFKTIQKIGDGSQIWRAVGLFFTREHICWLTDSHLEQNYVISMERDTDRITQHAPIDSPAWYCAQTTDGFYLAATTVERGPAVNTSNAFLLISQDAINWEVVISYKKDAWPMLPFKYGVISFPSGQFTSEAFWISGEGLIGLDGASALLCLVKG